MAEKYFMQHEVGKIRDHLAIAEMRVKLAWAEGHPSGFVYGFKEKIEALEKQLLELQLAIQDWTVKQRYKRFIVEYQPNRADIESAYRQLGKAGDSISIVLVKEKIEETAEKAGIKLVQGWWDILCKELGWL